MPPRGPTPYFLYAEEQRSAAKEELLAANAKTGVAQVAQLIGKKWGALSDEEKQAYKDRAQQLRGASPAEGGQGTGGGGRHSCRQPPPARPMCHCRCAAALAGPAAAQPSNPSRHHFLPPIAYPPSAEEAAVAAAAAAEQQSPGGEAGQAAEEGPAAPAAGAPPPPFGFPTGVVKRIMLVDEEVQRVSADAVRAIAKATELFVQQLAVRALEQAQAHKKKNFRLPEVLHVVGRDRCAPPLCQARWPFEGACMHMQPAACAFPAVWPMQGALPPAAVKVPTATCPNASTHPPLLCHYLGVQAAVRHGAEGGAGAACSLSSSSDGSRRRRRRRGGGGRECGEQAGQQAAEAG